MCNYAQMLQYSDRYSVLSFAKYIWILLGFTENLDLK